MTGTRYLVHGVLWDGAPAARLEHDGGSPVASADLPHAAALAARTIVPGDFASDVPAVQESLF